MEFSFYDWCIENNRQDILDRWNYDLNDYTPKELKFQSNKNVYFNCGCNQNHLPQKHRLYCVTKGPARMICRQCNSFYQWCLDHNKIELIQAWDDELNHDDIHFVSYGSGKKYYFKFLDKYPSIQCKLSDITGSSPIDPVARFYNSFGYYLINIYGNDAIQKYWSTKNTKSPWEYYKCSNQKVWLICQEKDYHDDYECSTSNFKGGKRCPWCAGKQVHPKDSFAQYYIDKFGADFLDKYWCKDNIVDPWTIRPSSAKIIKLQCQQKSYHKYNVTADHFSRGHFCPFCHGNKVHKLDSLGIKYPEIFNIWSSKNTKTPFEYRVASHEEVWLKCKCGKHNDYLRRIADYSYKHFTECPNCIREQKESHFQSKVRQFLENTSYQILHEYNCTIIPINPQTKCKMPFDNEVCNINGINLIVETHGIQHYELCGWHVTQSKHNNKTPQEEFEYQQWKDQFKKDYAVAHGYEYLEIPYYTVIDDTYTDLITSKINTILQETLETAGDI